MEQEYVKRTQGGRGGNSRGYHSRSGRGTRGHNGHSGFRKSEHNNGNKIDRADGLNLNESRSDLSYIDPVVSLEMTKQGMAVKQRREKIHIEEEDSIASQTNSLNTDMLGLFASNPADAAGAPALANSTSQIIDKGLGFV